MTRQKTGPLSMKNTIAMLLVCQIQSNECLYDCHLIIDTPGPLAGDLNWPVDLLQSQDEATFGIGHLVPDQAARMTS